MPTEKDVGGNSLSVTEERVVLPFTYGSFMYGEQLYGDYEYTTGKTGVVNITLFKEIGRILHSTSFFFKTFFEELTERALTTTKTFDIYLASLHNVGGKTMQISKELLWAWVFPVGGRIVKSVSTAGGYLIEWIDKFYRCRIRKN